MALTRSDARACLVVEDGGAELVRSDRPDVDRSGAGEDRGLVSLWPTTSVARRWRRRGHHRTGRWWRPRCRRRRRRSAATPRTVAATPGSWRARRRGFRRGHSPRRPTVLPWRPGVRCPGDSEVLPSPGRVGAAARRSPASARRDPPPRLGADQLRLGPHTGDAGQLDERRRYSAQPSLATLPVETNSRILSAVAAHPFDLHQLRRVILVTSRPEASMAARVLVAQP